MRPGEPASRPERPRAGSAGEPASRAAVTVGEVAAAIGGEVVGDASVELADLTHDSARVRPGTGFVCIRGAHADGHEHAPAAVSAGAPALLVERLLPLDVVQVQVPDSRAMAGPAAAVVHHHPSRSMDVVGVTGTNGKTTTVHLLAAILEAAGRSARMLGTLTGARTTPEGTDLQRLLAGWRREGVGAVAMEVSSHALVLHRVAGTRFAVAVFTSFGRDHLDFHRTEEEYFAAKAQLFEPGLSEQAVVNADDPRGRLLVDAATIPTTAFGLADARDLELHAAGARFRWRDEPVELALVGRFNVRNAVAAAAAAEALGIGAATVAAGLSAARPVPGRFEPVLRGQPFTALVDFAHTPDAVATAVASAAELAGDHRVIVVLGAGGDRDRDKRRPMGEAAARAHHVIVTTDNPRSEDPAEIAAVVAEGAGSAATVVLDRREAIAVALDHAEPGDVVLVAGKGHETTQVVGDQELPFDDRQVLAELLEERSGQW